MSHQVPEVTLDTIGGGALSELFAAELSRILDNIADVNTDPKTARKITIEVVVKPNATRDELATSLKCSSKLAGIMTVETRLYVGRRGGKIVAIENDPKQPGMFDDATQTGPRTVAFSGK